MAINGSFEDVIKNLSKDKLKTYIFHLTKRYYETYVEGDEKAFNHVIEQLHVINDEYRGVYYNLDGFVFFCLYLNANLIISKANSNECFELSNLFTYDLLEDDNFEDELHHDIKEIFNKERVRERYYEKRTSELIK